MQKKLKMSKSKDYLTLLFKAAPAAWALIRANEITALKSVDFINPVLDVGCGDGLVAKVILAGKGKFDWGIDLSDEEILKAKKSVAYKNCKIASVYNLPFKERTFKTVFSNSVVEHLENLDSALSEMSRVLKKDGKLVLTVPTPYLTDYLAVKGFFDSLGLNLLGTLYGKFFNKMFKHKNLYTHTQWEKIFKKHRLSLSQHKYYHSKSLVRIHEFLTFLAIPQHLVKKLINSWPVIPFIRNVFLPDFKRVLVNESVPSPQKEGGSLLLVATKVV